MQWEKDRETKAANKRKRALARQEAALSPYPNTHKKGGKKAAKKAARTAARQGRGGRRFDDSDSDAATLFEAPQATARKATNLRELNAQIGEFLADADRTTLVLPAMEKRARAQVHMLADAYNLKSKSRGKGHTRFPTLLKNSRSGLNVDRTRVARILGGHGNDGFGSGGGGGAGWKDRAGAKGKGKTATHGGALAPRNRDGTEVGWGAEKIKADNVGHRLLSMMG